MTLFVDASALVSIIRNEPDAPALEEAVVRDTDRITSGLALWEAAMAVARLTSSDVESGWRDVQRYVAAIAIRVVPIGADEALGALRAHRRYGKGTGEPAKLNMGDCFAYACTVTNDARLLYKGDDFSKTDLA